MPPKAGVVCWGVCGPEARPWACHLLQEAAATPSCSHLLTHLLHLCDGYDCRTMSRSWDEDAESSTEGEMSTRLLQASALWLCIPRAQRSEGLDNGFPSA